MADDLIYGMSRAMNAPDESDLHSAFSNFMGGMRSLALQRALTGASGQLQQIRSSESNDTQKMSAYQGVAQDLTMQMAGMGASASEIATARGAIPHPSPVQSPFELYATGDPDKQKMAMDYLKKAQDIKDANSSPDTLGDELKRARLKESQDKDTFNQTETIRKAVDPTTARKNTPLGSLGDTLLKVQRLQALVEHPEQITNRTMQEFARTTDSLYTGGVPTEGGTTHLVPPGLEQKRANLQEMLTSNPSIVNEPGFIQEYADTANRLGSVAQGALRAAQKKALSSNRGFAKNHPEELSQLSEQYLGEPATVTGGKVSFPSDVKEDELKSDVEAVISQPKSPRTQALVDKMKEAPEFVGMASRYPAVVNKLRAFAAKGGN